MYKKIVIYLLITSENDDFPAVSARFSEVLAHAGCFPTGATTAAGIHAPANMKSRN